MSARSIKKRRVLREARRKISAVLPHRAAELARRGGIEALNTMIVSNAESVANYYLKTGRWKT